MKLSFTQSFDQEVASATPRLGPLLAAGSGEANSSTQPFFSPPSIPSFIQTFNDFLISYQAKGNNVNIPILSTVINALEAGNSVKLEDLKTLLEYVAVRDHDTLSLLIYQLLPNCVETEGIGMLVDYAMTLPQWYPIYHRNSETSGILRPSLLDAVFVSGDVASIHRLVLPIIPEAPTLALTEKRTQTFEDVYKAIDLSLAIDPQIACATFAQLDPFIQERLRYRYPDIGDMSASKIIELVKFGSLDWLKYTISRTDIAGILKITSPDGETLLQLAKDRPEVYKYLLGQMTYQEFPFVSLLASGFKDDALREFQNLQVSNPTIIRAFFRSAKQSDAPLKILEIVESLAGITSRDDIIRYLGLESIDITKFLSEKPETSERVKINLGTEEVDGLLIALQKDPTKLELIKKLVELGANPFSGRENSAMAVAVMSENHEVIRSYLDVNYGGSSADHLQIALSLREEEYFFDLLKFVLTYSSKTEILGALQQIINLEPTEGNQKIVKILVTTYADSDQDFSVFKAFLDNTDSDVNYFGALTGIIESVVRYMHVSKLFDINKPASTDDKASLVGHYATTNSPEAILALRSLLNVEGVNLEIEDKNGDVPLIAALANKCIDAFTLLVNNGANKHAENLSGEGLLHIAMYYDVPELLDAIIDMLAQYEATQNDLRQKDAIRIVTEKTALNGVSPLGLGLMQCSYSAVSALLLKYNVPLDKELFKMAYAIHAAEPIGPQKAYPKILDFILAYSAALLQNNIDSFRDDFVAAENEADQIAYIDQYLSNLILPHEELDDGEVACAASARPPLEALKIAFIENLARQEENEDQPPVIISIAEFFRKSTSLQYDETRLAELASSSPQKGDLEDPIAAASRAYGSCFNPDSDTVSNLLGGSTTEDSD